MSAPYILEPGQSKVDLGPFRVLADATSGAHDVALYEGHLPEGGPPLHRHDFDEAILLLSGRLLVHLDGDEREVGAGAFLWLPAGCTHTFANPDPTPVHAIGIGLPSDILALFAERGAAMAAADGALDAEVMADIYARHASEVLGPPLHRALQS